MARKIALHHLGKATKLEFKVAGRTNFVFDTTTPSGKFIIRIAGAKDKFNDLKKEQWAIQQATNAGVPVPKIIDVGNEIIPYPYMIQKSIRGEEAMNHPARLEILKELGRYAKIIHSIPTNGFGHHFDWSDNKHAKKKTWIEYLQNELKVDEGLRFLGDHQFLTTRKLRRLIFIFKRIKQWTIAPSLNHGDLRLKNVIVNKAGKIKAILDWDNCNSNVAPYWDLSIALHDLSIDAKEKFLEGYEPDVESLRRNAYALTAFNLINYIPVLRNIISDDNTKVLDLYRLRLDGSLDVFSL
jgi:aminoglycoside phosphotransferase (APT) family kinase protein